MRLSYPLSSGCILLTALLMSSSADAQPFSGTIFIDPDIITPADPGSLVSVTYAGQGLKTVWDYRVPGWVEINAYLFDVVWNDGITSLAVVNPEFATQSAAAFEADRYADALGRVPTCLRTGVDELWIHAGVASFGGGNNAIVIHTGRGEEYIADGILEEAFVHEGTHCSLDAIHAAAPGWLAAQSADPDFISTYAAGAPTTEDLAESYLPWLAVRYRASRISTALYEVITEVIPNRLAYLDGITCDLYPITSGVGIPDQVMPEITLYPNPTNGQAIRVESVEALQHIDVLDATGRLVGQYGGTVRMIPAPEEAGAYFVRTTGAGGKRSVTRVVRY